MDNSKGGLSLEIIVFNQVTADRLL